MRWEHCEAAASRAARASGFFLRPLTPRLHRRQVLHALRASAYIPGYSGPNATIEYRGKPAFDGAFSQFLPCPPNVTYCIKARLGAGGRGHARWQAKKVLPDASLWSCRPRSCALLTNEGRGRAHMPVPRPLSPKVSGVGPYDLIGSFKAVKQGRQADTYGLLLKTLWNLVVRRQAVLGWRI
jgi:hypothetical protein